MHLGLGTKNVFSAANRNRFSNLNLPVSVVPANRAWCGRVIKVSHKVFSPLNPTTPTKMSAPFTTEPLSVTLARVIANMCAETVPSSSASAESPQTEIASQDPDAWCRDHNEFLRTCSRCKADFQTDLTVHPAEDFAGDDDLFRTPPARSPQYKVRSASDYFIGSHKSHRIIIPATPPRAASPERPSPIVIPETPEAGGARAESPAQAEEEDPEDRIVQVTQHTLTRLRVRKQQLRFRLTAANLNIKGLERELKRERDDRELAIADLREEIATEKQATEELTEDLVAANKKIGYLEAALEQTEAEETYTVSKLKQDLEQQVAENKRLTELLEQVKTERNKQKEEADRAKKAACGAVQHMAVLRTLAQERGMLANERGAMIAGLRREVLLLSQNNALMRPRSGTSEPPAKKPKSQ